MSEPAATAAPALRAMVYRFLADRDPRAMVYPLRAHRGRENHLVVPVEDVLPAD